MNPITNHKSIISISSILPGLICGLLYISVKTLLTYLNLSHLISIFHISICLGFISYCTTPPFNRRNINFLFHLIIPALLVASIIILDFIHPKTSSETNYPLLFFISLFWAILQSAVIALKRTQSRFSIVWHQQLQLIFLSVSLGVCVGLAAYFILLIVSLGQLISPSLLILMVFVFVSYGFEYFHQEKNIIKTKILLQSRLGAYLSLFIAFVICLFNIVIISIAKDIHSTQLNLPISLEAYLYTFYGLLLLGIVITPTTTPKSSNRSIHHQIAQFILLLLPVSFFSLTCFFNAYYAVNGLTKTSFWFMLAGYSILFPIILNSLAIIKQKRIQLQTLPNQGLFFKETLFKINLFYLVCLSILLFCLSIIPNLINKAVVANQVNRIIDGKTEIKIDYDLFEFQTGQEGIKALNTLASYTLNDPTAHNNLNFKTLKNNPKIKNSHFASIPSSNSSEITNLNDNGHVQTYLLDNLRLYPNNSYLPKDIYQKIADYLTTDSDLYCMKPKADYLEENQGKIWVVDQPTCFIQIIHPNQFDKSFTVYAIYGYENAYSAAYPSRYLIVDKQTEQIKKFEATHLTHLYGEAIAYRVNDNHPIKTPEAYESLISKHFRFIQPQFKLVEIGGKIFAISDKNPDVSNAIEVNHE